MRHELSREVRMPVFGTDLARRSFKWESVHLFDTILAYLAHFSVLVLHGQERVAIKGISSGTRLRSLRRLAVPFCSLMSTFFYFQKKKKKKTSIDQICTKYATQSQLGIPFRSDRCECSLFRARSRRLSLELGTLSH